MRVFLGFAEIAGYMSSLKQGFDVLGVDCEFADLGVNPFQYKNDSKSHTIKLVKKIVNLESNAKSKFSRMFFRILKQFIKLPLLIDILLRYDALILPASSALFRHYEFVLCKLFRVKVIVICLGSDSRPAYISGLYMHESSDYSLDDVYKVAKTQKKRMSRIDKYADFVVEHTAAGHFHERELVRYLSIGFPREKRNMSEVGQVNKEIKILHAPSKPELKGSDYFAGVIDKLKGEGHKINYVQLAGVPNKQVLAELESCDFVVDELYSDIPLAGFASEAAGFGKPSVVGSYLDMSEQSNFSKEVPPSLFVVPEKTEEAIRLLVEDAPYRQELGKKAKSFVDNTWCSKVVAQKFLDIISGEYPDDWNFSANDVTYLHGWGISEKDLKKQLSFYINKFGKEGLFLADKPKLGNAFLKFVENVDD